MVHVRVQSEEIDGDDSGREWQVQYVLQDGVDDDGVPRYELYSDDGEGNGVMIASGSNLPRMRALTLRLGEFISWK